MLLKPLLIDTPITRKGITKKKFVCKCCVNFIKFLFNGSKIFSVNLNRDFPMNFQFENFPYSCNGCRWLFGKSLCIILCNIFYVDLFEGFFKGDFVNVCLRDILVIFLRLFFPSITKHGYQSLTMFCKNTHQISHLTFPHFSLFTQFLNFIHIFTGKSCKF